MACKEMSTLVLNSLILKNIGIRNIEAVTSFGIGRFSGGALLGLVIGHANHSEAG